MSTPNSAPPQVATKTPAAKRVALVLAVLTSLVGCGAALWWKLRPAEPEKTPESEQQYKDIERGDYEKWMQEIGYTE